MITYSICDKWSSVNAAKWPFFLPKAAPNPIHTPIWLTHPPLSTASHQTHPHRVSQKRSPIILLHVHCCQSFQIDRRDSIREAEITPQNSSARHHTESFPRSSQGPAQGSRDSLKEPSPGGQHELAVVIQRQEAACLYDWNKISAAVWAKTDDRLQRNPTSKNSEQKKRYPPNIPEATKTEKSLLFNSSIKENYKMPS